MIALQELNKGVECAGISFALNSLNCTGECLGVYQTPLLSSFPLCSSRFVSSLYAGLRQFVIEEDSLLQRMINALNSTRSDTPQSKLVNVKRLFVGMSQDFAAVTKNIGGFLQLLPPIQGGLSENANCTLLRKELLNLEASGCFQFNNHLNHFACVLAFLVISILLFCWTIYFVLIFMSIRVETLVASAPVRVKRESSEKLQL